MAPRSTPGYAAMKKPNTLPTTPATVRNPRTLRPPRSARSMSRAQRKAQRLNASSAQAPALIGE